MSEQNVQKGRDFILEIFNDVESGTGLFAWQKVGGIRTKDFNADNPVTDTTSQSSEGDYTESQFTGYSTVTFNGSGVVDARSSDAVSAYKLLEQKAMTAGRCARFRLIDAYGVLEGVFNITTFSKNAEQQGLTEFTFAAQSASQVNYV
jgi:TP901-1 family phage major tail protein